MSSLSQGGAFAGAAAFGAPGPFGRRPRKGGPVAPQGYVLLVGIDGAYLTDADGAYLMEPA